MTRIRLGLVCCAAVGLLAITAGVSSAQSAISGVVRDTSGAVLPGVTVEASSPALIERVRTAVSDGQGIYRIIDLRPGTFTIVYTLPGFATVRREGLELPDLFTATVNIELRVGALEETVTVTGASPLVDVQNVIQTTTMAKELTDALPSGRFLQHFVTYMPGVTGANIGLVGTDTRKFWIHGGRQVDALIAVDGFSTNFVPGFSGNSSFYVNMAMVQETGVQTGGQNAEQQFGGIFTNVIPKEGGNTYTGYLSADYTSERFVGSNIGSDLEAKGVTEGSSNKLLYTLEPALGGPLVQDRMWFFMAARNQIVDRFRTVPYDLDPLDFIFTPDLSREPTHSKIEENDWSLRLTSQVTPNNKLILFFDQQPHYFHQRNFARNVAAESTNFASYWPNVVTNATWKSTVSNKLFIDGGVNRYILSFTVGPSKDPGYLVDPFSLTPVLDDDLDLGFRSSGGYAGPGWSRTPRDSWVGRVSATYVTGSHNVKFGWQWRYGRRWGGNPNSNDVSIRIADNDGDGIPEGDRIRQDVKPQYRDWRGFDGGLYVQDQWTVNQATFNVGVRWDYLNEWIPENALPAGRWVDAVTYPRVDHVASFRDINPRMGIAYDLFGDGMTAIKGTVNRYIVNQLVGVAGANDPAQLTVRRITRSFNDANGNFIPDCDLGNRLANAECGQVSNLNFGLTNPTNLGWDPSIREGYGTRNYNWEYSAQLAQQVAQGVSLNAGYFRRTYGGIVVLDNLDLDRSQNDPYCVTTPVNAGLPGGGGQELCGLWDQNVPRTTKNLTTSSDKFSGETSEMWQGVDIGIQARFGRGGTIGGGSSTGRTHIVNCAAPDTPTVLYCDTTEPWLTQIKFRANYPLPWYGLQLSGVYQNNPGKFLTARSRFRNAAINPSLGRNLTRGSSSVNVHLIQPRTQTLDRQTQFDMRLGKNWNAGRVRMTTSVDFFNLFNSSGIINFSDTVNATWPTPTEIQQPRMAKFDFKMTF